MREGRLIAARLSAIAYMLLIFIASSQSNLETAGIQRYPDYLLHFLEYLVLGLLLSWSFTGGFVNKIRAGFLVSAGYALFDELHQYFVPGRVCSLQDYFFDLAGATCGLILGAIIIQNAFEENSVLLKKRGLAD